MILHPPAKINIGLSVTEKRHDGFHDIETVFYSIPLCDILSVETVETDAVCQLAFSCDGIELPDNGRQDNLCCKAYQLLDADYHLPPVSIHLHKAVPVGAGLGGGSSDAVYTLQALNRLFKLHLNNEELTRYANQLGSDCAFFLLGKPAFGTGTGNILAPISLSLAGYYILLVKPPVFVSTAGAYASITPQKANHHLPELLQAPISEWRHSVFNDFEMSVFQMFPEIGKIKEKLYAEGAVYASMSGSGSTVYGIFDKKPDDVAKLFPDCSVWSLLVTHDFF